MRNSLIGQSEVLTLSGVYLFSSGETTLGIVCGILGLIGAICRYSIKTAQNQVETEQDSDEYAKLSKILSEIYKNQ